MRDFELLQAVCSQREVNEQTRISTIYGGTEDRDPARGGQASRRRFRAVQCPVLARLEPLALAIAVTDSS
jgi:hypothetical protein